MQIRELLEPLMCYQCLKQHDDKLVAALLALKAEVLKAVPYEIELPEDICGAKITMADVYGYNEALAQVKSNLEQLFAGKQ